MAKKSRRKARRHFPHNIIALVYDFDGTLTPQPMQEYTVFPEIGITGTKFWPKVKKEAEETQGDEITTYMRLLVEHSREKHYRKGKNNKAFPITKKRLRALAKKIRFYKGVETYFQRINKYVNKKSNGKVHVRHYLLSSGLKEIILGTKIKKYFHNIFASEYHYNEYDAVDFPKNIINDTLKTQFLFRINKGKEKLHENINSHTPYHKRVIPFENILYIGDGMTDVPCMTVTNKERGYSIAVYDPEHPKKGLSVCRELLTAARVDFVAKADYRPSSNLYKAITMVLDSIIQGITFRKEYFRQNIKYTRG